MKTLITRCCIKATLAIYKKRFWDPLRADEISSFSIAYALYDVHVNAPGHAIKIMQESLNTLGSNLIADNKIGKKTIDAINSADSKKLFDVYQKKRSEYYVYRTIVDPTQKVFLVGWLNRVRKMNYER